MGYMENELADFKDGYFLLKVKVPRNRPEGPDGE
jgi:hypothetical protein